MGSLVDRIKTKLDFSKNNKKTATGQEADDIEVNPVSLTIREAATKEKHAVFTFGRFNPPTTGHQKLVDAVKKHAEKTGAEHHIFASQSQDKKKNPLSHPEKVGFMKKMFPNTNVHSGNDVKNALDAAKHLQHRGVTHATMVVGSDRVDEFHHLLSKYNKHPSEPDFDPKKHFHIPHLTVISAGHRDPDAEGVEGMSASKMRDHAVNGNYNLFKSGVPNKAHAKDMYHAVRKNMGINEDVQFSPQTQTHLSDYDKVLQKRAVQQKKLANKEDRDGQKTASSRPVGHSLKNVVKSPPLPSSMTQNPYESRQYVVPWDRDEMAPGKKPVDIGMGNTEGKTEEEKGQMLRRKARKLFKKFIEVYDPGSSVPSPINTAIPTVTAKKNIQKTVKEAGMFGDTALGTSDERPSAFDSSQMKATVPLSKKVNSKKQKIQLTNPDYKVENPMDESTSLLSMIKERFK